MPGKGVSGSLKHRKIEENPLIVRMRSVSFRWKTADEKSEVVQQWVKSLFCTAPHTLHGCEHFWCIFLDVLYYEKIKEQTRQGDARGTLKKKKNKPAQCCEKSRATGEMDSADIQQFAKNQWGNWWLLKHGVTEGRGMKNKRRRMDLPAGRIPMCCWPSSTKLPIGWPSGLYAAPWLTEGSRRKPDCSQNVDMKKGGGGRRRENTPDNQQLSQLQPKHTVRHCACVCGPHWLTRGMQTRIQSVLMHASTHTCAYVQPVSFKTTLTGVTLFSNAERKTCSLTGWEEFLSEKHFTQSVLRREDMQSTDYISSP